LLGRHGVVAERLEAAAAQVQVASGGGLCVHNAKDSENPGTDGWQAHGVLLSLKLIVGQGSIPRIILVSSRVLLKIEYVLSLPTVSACAWARPVNRQGIQKAILVFDRRNLMSKTENNQPFLTDVQELRKRARTSLDKGAVTPAYQGDVQQTIDILQSVLATEIVCVLRYTMNAIAATGISSESVKKEFEQHAKEEQGHMREVAERINQLGGTPNFNPEGLLSRSASEYKVGENLIEMIKENLVAERIACEHYRELIRYFADKDPTTRVMMEGILTNEEEHANDMHDLLVAHEGTPMLSKS